jgi:hypothetical protein
MALNKDVLGLALYNRLDTYNNQDIDAIGDIEAARLAFCKALADEVIQHFRTAGVVSVTVTTTGTAAAHTGTGTGTIN